MSDFLSFLLARVNCVLNFFVERKRGKDLNIKKGYADQLLAKLNTTIFINGNVIDACRENTCKLELTVEECKILAGFTDFLINYLEFCDANGMDHHFDEVSIDTLHRLDNQLISLIEES